MYKKCHNAVFFWPLFSHIKAESKILSLTHFFPMHPFSNTFFYGFLMFSGGRERVHWERMNKIEKKRVRENPYSDMFYTVSELRVSGLK